jgi:hypothetical protein
LWACNGVVNYLGYCNRRVTRLLLTAATELSSSKRDLLLNRADALMARDLPCGVRKFGLACKSRVFGMSTEWCAPHGSEARFFLLIGDLCDAPFALDADDEAAPGLRARVLAEPVVDAVDDLVELAVCERPDEDHAGMLATRF